MLDILPFNRVLAKTEGCGRFSSPLRRLRMFSISPFNQPPGNRGVSGDFHRPYERRFPFIGAVPRKMPIKNPCSQRNLGNKDRMDILRYHLVCRGSGHLMQTPTRPLPDNAGIASEDTKRMLFPLPSAAHLPACLPPCSQLCRTLCGSDTSFTSASSVLDLTCNHHTTPFPVCQ